MYWILDALVKMLPAYLGNSAPVFLGKIKTPLLRPIDAGKKLNDGSRLLGDGKTWQGVFSSMIGGALGGYIASFFRNGSIPTGIIIGFAAIFGDMIGSFTKRRLKMKRGDKAGLLDQMDFITVSLIVASMFYSFDWKQILFILLSTPLIHRTSNIVGYKLGLKQVPW